LVFLLYAYATMRGQTHIKKHISLLYVDMDKLLSTSHLLER